MFENKINSRCKSAIFFLLMFYPILPMNYYLSIFSFVNICSILIVTIYILGSRNSKIFPVFKYNFFFWMYLIIYAILAISTANFLKGFAWIITEIIVSIILIQLITSEKDIYRIIELIIIASIFLSLIGLIESFSHTYLIQASIFKGWSDSLRYGILRCSGPFGHPINFGFYQAIAALLAFYRLNSKLEKKKKKWYRLAYSLAVITMFLTISRLAICFFVATQLILIILMGQRKAIKYLCIIFLVAVGAIIALDTFGVEGYVFISDFFVSLGRLVGFKGQASSSGIIGFGNRFDLYEWVINDVGSNYIFGKGVGAEFAYKLTDWFTKTSIEVNYLYIYFQCGLVGLIALILSYVGSVRYFWKKRKYSLPNENKLTYIRVLLVILVLYYVCLFGVQETDLTRLHCELISLGIAYYRICRYKCQVLMTH
ncbi:O-antigen ligase family protein [Anaeromicropila herbilytica]|uniref:O-antigen ligase domain-containing protein n=1 Tax=Anaeromicropila herbilytica TaxID=2785025 RepID=A0A7R7EP96_9FIRM|nr:O-antigen ligase family protein [Anaeromicropila herbilytica]BCN32281.1 hypothetical protein bsdtb5_35760 [Anaeromicropila herbilytica]